MSARITMTPDVAELIGESAQKVENRSLLIDKFPFHKSWPLTGAKWDDASRWSLLRIADGGSQQLRKESTSRRDRAGRPNVNPQNAEQLTSEAALAESLSNVVWNSTELSALRVSHTRRFIGLVHRTIKDRSRCIIAQLEGRLAINLANGLIQNAGLSLDRLFGLPFIPGSAIKGAARHAAIHQLNCAPQSELPNLFSRFRLVFGTAESDFSAAGELHSFRNMISDQEFDFRGRVSFLPAYPVNDAKIVVDLTNVHYPDYYRSGRLSDLANERPQPNPFPAIEVGAQFAVFIVSEVGHEKSDLLDYANQWVELALTVHGIGAKTAAGYGWFSLQPVIYGKMLAMELKELEERKRIAKIQAEEVAKKEAENAHRALLTDDDKAFELLAKLNSDDFAAKCLDLEKLQPPEQRAFLRLLQSDKKDTWKSWKKSEKPSSKTRVEQVKRYSQLHGIQLL